METKEFPNGFLNWIETHHVIVEEITRKQDTGGMVDLIMESQGTGGLWELGQSLTDEFEKLVEGEDWVDDRDYFEEISEFLNSKNL